MAGVSKYKDMWEAGRMPTLEELRQHEEHANTVRWKVWLQIAPRWNDTKHIFTILKTGYNVDKSGAWGWYEIREGVSIDDFLPEEYLILDYAVMQNNPQPHHTIWQRIRAFFARRIVDHIRIMTDGRIIGKFHLRIRGKLVRLSWFTMERVES